MKRLLYFVMLAVLALAAGVAEAANDVSLDLTRAVNRGVKSTPEEASAPLGWTNDGPGNDLRTFPAGVAEYGGIRFEVIDPATNDGKSVMVLAGLPERGAMTLTLPVGRRIGSALYLLHAASWIGDTQRIVGKFIVRYADGEVEGYEVNKNVDIGDWWDPVDRENARCVWTGRNPSAAIGIFLSGFPIADKPIESIEFQAQSNVGWLILGATGSDVPVRKVENPGEYVVLPDENWHEISYPARPKAGTILDFSFLLDAPAGKHGRLVLNDRGQFEFADAPGRRVKFYGTNFCESTAFLDHESAALQAAEVAAIGYNSVRLHHYEVDMLKPDAKHSLDYDPMRFDQLDYLIAELKKRGVYLTMDAFCSRVPFRGEIAGLEEWGDLTFHHYKQLFPIHAGALENLKEHLRIFFTHKNPYTGLTYAEEPALVTLSLVNENEIFGAYKLHPGVAKLYEDAFAAELQAAGVAVESLDELERSRRMSVFLAGKQRAMVAELTRFMREELNCEILITDNNAQYSMLHNMVGERLDFVDSHVYFDHPWFPEVAWRLPEQLKNVSAVERLAEAPRDIFANRIAGKPFTITEFNYCFPNRFRAESGPMMGAYCALQDHDGLFRFDYIYNRGKFPEPQHVGGLSSGNDPACIIGEQIGLLFFLRGDVRKAEKSYALVYGESLLEDFDRPLHMTTAREWNTTAPIPETFTRLGLISKVASVNVNELDKRQFDEAFLYHELPTADLRRWRDVAATEFQVGDDARVYTSDTGEITLDAAAGTFKVDTPRAAALCTAFSGEESVGPLRIQGPKGQRTTALVAMDEKSLRESQSLLFYHLTTVYNTGTVFGDKTMRRLEAIGSLPMLVYRDVITVRLNLAAADTLEVVALHGDGTEAGVVPSRIEAGELVFEADSAAAKGRYVYHIRPGK